MDFIVAGRSIVEVVVARLEAGDVPEDKAAATVAASLAGTGFRLRRRQRARQPAC